MIFLGNLSSPKIILNLTVGVLIFDRELNGDRNNEWTSEISNKNIFYCRSIWEVAPEKSTKAIRDRHNGTYEGQERVIVNIQNTVIFIVIGHEFAE